MSSSVMVHLRVVGIKPPRESENTFTGKHHFDPNGGHHKPWAGLLSSALESGSGQPLQVSLFCTVDVLETPNAETDLSKVPADDSLVLQQRLTTRTGHSVLNPVWNEVFTFPINSRGSDEKKSTTSKKSLLVFTIWNDNVSSTDYVCHGVVQDFGARGIPAAAGGGGEAADLGCTLHVPLTRPGYAAATSTPAVLEIKVAPDTTGSHHLPSSMDGTRMSRKGRTLGVPDVVVGYYSKVAAQHNGQLEALGQPQTTASIDGPHQSRGLGPQGGAATTAGGGGPILGIARAFYHDVDVTALAQGLVVAGSGLYIKAGSFNSHFGDPANGMKKQFKIQLVDGRQGTFNEDQDVRFGLVATLEPGTVRLKSCHGTYLRAHPGPGGKVDLQSNPPKEWEMYVLEPAPQHSKSKSGEGTHFSLRTYHRTYLRADPTGFVNTAPKVQEWEVWAVNPAEGGLFTFTSYHGQHLQGQPGGEGAKVAQSPNKLEWERWSVEYI